MSTTDLHALADELLGNASAASSGRDTRVFHGAPGGALSQVVLALVAGQDLSDHENPGEATLQVLRGRVELVAGEDSWQLGTGEHLVIPQRRHHLNALEDSVFILTVVRQ